MKRKELRALSQEELDEAVHEAKAAEAAEINNRGREAQVAYLDEDRERREELEALETEFDNAGGRGVDLADEIDRLREELGED